MKNSLCYYLRACPPHIDHRYRITTTVVNIHRPGYRWKAGSETRTMAVSLGRSDVPGAQHGDLAESPGSRDFRGRFLPPKPNEKSNSVLSDGPAHSVQKESLACKRNLGGNFPKCDPFALKSHSMQARRMTFQQKSPAKGIFDLQKESLACKNWSSLDHEFVLYLRLFTERHIWRQPSRQRHQHRTPNLQKESLSQAVPPKIGVR